MCTIILNKMYFSGMSKLSLFLLSISLSFVVGAQTILFPIQIKDKWGYTNVQGKMVIAPMYDYAESFCEGYAVVALNNQPCVINSANMRVIDTGLYSSIQRFSEGFAKVRDYKNHQFFIDYEGNQKIVVNDAYYDARPFHNGLSLVAQESEIHETKFGKDISTLGYRFGYMNKQGEIVIPIGLDDADDFVDGIARYKQGTKFGLLDSNGKKIIEAKYFNIGAFHDNLAIVDAGGRYGFINNEGKEVIKPIYEFATDFSEGLAGVMIKGKYGFINADGKLIINPEYDAVRPFSQGLAAVKVQNKWGFIDANGKLKMGYVFDNATMFSDDRCAILLKRRWGFIDTTGRLVISAEYDAVGIFKDGLAEVLRGKVSAYVNKNGTVIPILR